MELLGSHRCFGGEQRFYRHQSEQTATPMCFALYLPPAAAERKVPVLWFLSGLTCTEQNFATKSGAQRYAAEHGIALLAPDTSPRGCALPGEDDSYDFGRGAGFYLDATEAPWRDHYRMYSYLTVELQALVFESLPLARGAQGICGHSMGGHGALTIGLRNPGLYRSISAFSPICAPSQCPWGQKALGAYLGLGEERQSWRSYDAVCLIEDGHRSGEILVDQGGADEFLEPQLMPQQLQQCCDQHDQPLRLRMQDGYDHSYYFIASFIGEHLAFHAERLAASAAS